ncbi:hypothetical protein EMIHUDRAFT_246345 [Emiliania huxleyi CCMP1516]|uniref:glucan 1,3-beta-glucosidase n=2 Tax=Emiliania huxleyi TaxID=2903 RepID=A0A0D3ISJ4_EMIH1|nr:hypothetical protein EMIHUDRAFT_246345 [Emiliania huxleyi CCMP1516]EOD14229.1 hypothetical protein EMIHUDRAFT_246345 [Emiliania huxleyi CCMP1516]|eukprot:XP_005766658.1 hypothetical protein EMIHUDRAFT_246345 [Emiliania huxleyi CCMP1516]
MARAWEHAIGLRSVDAFSQPKQLIELQPVSAPQSDQSAPLPSRREERPGRQRRSVLIYLAAAALLLALLATILIIEALRMKNPPPAPPAAVPRGWGGRFGVNLGAVFVPEPGFAASLFAEMPRPSPWDGDWASVVQAAGLILQSHWLSLCTTISPLCAICCGSATGREAARARYLAHIDRYIDGPLLAELAAAGNTLLRVPLGFWNLLAFPGPGGLRRPRADYLPRLERLLVRAEAAGFTAVLLDMHAPACSANGEEHGGVSLEGSKGLLLASATARTPRGEASRTEAALEARNLTLRATAAMASLLASRTRLAWRAAPSLYASYYEAAAAVVRQHAGGVVLCG